MNAHFCSLINSVGISLGMSVLYCRLRMAESHMILFLLQTNVQISINDDIHFT